MIGKGSVVLYLAGIESMGFSHLEYIQLWINGYVIIGLYYKLSTIVIDAARSDAANWSVTLMIVIDDTS